MSFAADQIRKQPRKLGKTVRKLPIDTGAKRVHDLRTRTRRMEAMLQALHLDSRKNERRLLKAVKPVRKKAGKVRDMDVLTGFALSTRLDNEKPFLVRLLEHLGTQRGKHARILQKIANARVPEIKKRLKR